MSDENSFDANDSTTWPSTSQVFDKPKTIFNDHDWLQSGYTAIDQCCDHPPISLPNGKMLIKDGREYHLIDELKGQ